MNAINKNPLIAIVGEYQIGKSMLVNCLMEEKVASVGHGIATTRFPCRFTFGDSKEAWIASFSSKKRSLGCWKESSLLDQKLLDDEQFLVCVQNRILKDVDIVDTPGLNENDDIDRRTKRVLELPDLELVVVVLEKALSERDLALFRQIKDSGRKALCVLNCRDMARWNPHDSQSAEICSSIQENLKNLGLDKCLFTINGKSVLAVNALWAWYALGHLEKDLHAQDPRIAKQAEADFKLIRKYWQMESKWQIPVKSEILEASGIETLRAGLENYHLMRVKHFLLEDPSRLVTRLAKDLAERLKQLTQN